MTENSAAPIDGEVNRFDELSWMTWADIATGAEIAEYHALAESLTARLRSAAPVVRRDDVFDAIESALIAKRFKLKYVDMVVPIATDAVMNLLAPAASVVGRDQECDHQIVGSALEWTSYGLKCSKCGQSFKTELKAI